MNILKRVRSKAFAILGITAIAASIIVPVTQVSAQGCDNANSIMCNGASSKQNLQDKINSGDGTNSAANLQQIYYNENRNITRDGATSIMSDQTVDGVVNKDGTVTVNGSVVASNVWSSGRDFLQGSVKDGSVWMRPPAVSFNSPSLTAFVNMAGGHFNWAIIKSCGNPVREISSPFGQIFKRVVDVTKDPNTNFAADDQAHALEVSTGDTLRYEITVTNNGSADMTNTHVTDSLPTGVTLVSNPSKRFIGDSASAGVSFGTVKPNSVSVYTATVTVDSNVPNGTLIDNQACFTADHNQTGCDHAWIKVKNTCVSNCTSVTPSCTQSNNCTPTCTQSNNCTTPTPTPTCTQANNCTTTTSSCTQANNCTTTTSTPPTSLPQTGAEGAFAGIFGTAGIGYSLRSYLRSKRNLLASLLGRR